MASSSTDASRKLVARQLTSAQKPFQEGEEKYWSNGSIAMTEYFHTYSVLFPEGENFFTRSVLAYARHPSVTADPALLQDVRGFVSQVPYLLCLLYRRCIPSASYYICASLYSNVLSMAALNDKGGSPRERPRPVQQGGGSTLRTRHGRCKQASRLSYIYI